MRSIRLTDDQRALADQHVEWSERVAARYVSRLPRLEHVITSAAFLGLCRAARRFDPSWDVRFTTFAIHYVEGQIKDDLIREVCKGFRRNPSSAPKVFPCGRREYRSADGHTSEDDGADEVVFENFRPIGSTPDREIGSELEDLEAFEQQIQSVPANYRPLLRLLFVGDMSMRSAAESLGLHPTVASRWYTLALAELGAKGRHRRYRSAQARRARAC